MERAVEILRGEMIIFSVSAVLLTTFLNMSKANKFPDPMSET
jgi:uncharacterized membrane protein affecting hemolysin expression